MSVVIQTQNAGTAADDPLLTYQITTTPSPLKASPENPQAPEEIGELIISVARQSGTPADVEWIKVKVPAGTMAPDLATDLNKISPRISLSGWTVRLDAAAREFVCAPVGSHAPIGPGTGFTIQLSDIPISRKVGTAPVTVTERSRTGDADFEARKTIFNLGKFPADFYLRNFQCEPSIIPNGGDVKLTWERSANATYELLYPGVDRDVTNRTSLPIEGITSDTTFYLRGTTGDPSNPVVRILSTHLTVLKPDLDIGNLIVNGTVIAKGDVTIAPGNQLAVPKIVGNGSHIEVAGNIHQSAGGISVSTGGLTVDGNATVSGELTATSVTARNSLTAGLPTASALPEGMAGHTADKMLDGRDDTYYQSRLTPYFNDWAMVDLGEIRRITRIDIHFTASGVAGRVETSNDRTTWTPRGAITPPLSSHTLPNGGAEVRYVRFLVVPGQLFVFQIRHFIITPGGSFTAGFSSSRSLGTEPTGSADAAAVTNGDGSPAQADTQTSATDAPLPLPGADADAQDGTRT
ncbi:discoidin domain-containing protein [Kitasatospora sp. NPDC127116]|uniref:galactose-binding domain-containing protein n=1 Tax=unclassified Kitasatospora TaxID=2633591 RepID=UPI00336D56E0